MSQARRTYSSAPGDDRRTGPSPALPAPLALEDHLYLANVALIKKQHVKAVKHLESAVAHDSSLGCSILAGLLLRSAMGLRSPPSSSAARRGYFEFDRAPTSSSSPSGSTAASLFAKGLAIELAKPLGPSTALTQQASNEDEEDESEGSAEGNTFNLERAQDLLVGLTSCFRFGLIPGDDSTDGMALASRGELLARQALMHFAVSDARIAALIVTPTLSPPHSPSLPLTPALVFALTCPPRPTTVHIPTPPRTRRAAKSPTEKQRYTVQVSALYILALQAWAASNRDVAESYWRYSVELSQSLGGSIGTKEGDEIVGKARERLTGLDLARKPEDQSRHPTSRKLVLDRSGYPSPPDTPSSSPPDSAAPSQLASVTHSVASSTHSIDTTSVNSIEQPPRVLRHRGSTTSLNAPRLLRRVASSASISTEPPDFGRPRVGGSNWQQIGGPTMSGIALDGATGRPSPPRRAVSSPLAQTSAAPTPSASPALWTSVLRQRFSSLRGANPVRRDPTPTSAINQLRQVLKRDDESAGPGMYWADDPDMEEEQEQAFPLPVATSNTAAPALPRQRSFVDPTTPSGAIPVRSRSPSPIPVVDITPPTPQKDVGLLLPPRPSRRSRKKSLPSYSISPSSFKPMPPLDPFLAKLERESRVGVQTKCRECGKEGLNFSACPKCESHYCSRTCRIASGGESGRHSCAR